MSTTTEPNDVDEGWSLRPVLEHVVASRRRLLLVWLAAASASVVLLTLFYASRPYERTASVRFRLLFDGVERSQYPNGARFSRSDILAPSVLTEVYRKNELERYMSYEKLRSSVFVLESSAAIDMLNFEYSAKLSDPRLPSPERSRLEAEFRQKLESIREPELSLQFTTSSVVQWPPSDVMEKVLNDILAEWAEQTANAKGALGHQVELLTPNVIVKDTLNTQTTLIRYDLLRRHVGRISAQLQRLADLPGATTARVGTDRLSLIDLKTNLEDLLEFQLNPLIRRRLVYAITPAELGLNTLYLEDRVLELERERDLAERRRQQLQAAATSIAAESSLPEAALRPESGANAPQTTDSFLDRVIDLASSAGAVEYRKDLTNRMLAAGEEAIALESDIAFYRETLRLLRGASGGSRPGALQPEDVAKTFQDIQTRVVEILTLSNEAYATISASNLNPRGSLYSLRSPYSLFESRTHSRAWFLRTAMLLMVFSLLAVVGWAMLDRLVRLNWARV